MTWIALLGGMLAIPYYFWSENETPSQARKDVIDQPLPSLSPPRFAPPAGQNEIAGRKHPKRQRRPHDSLLPPPFPQDRTNRFPKLPPGTDPKLAYDKQYKNWYNNHFFRQFNQHPPGMVPPPGVRPPMVLPQRHPLQNRPQIIGQRPPLPLLQPGLSHLNAVGVTQGAPASHQAFIGTDAQHLRPINHQHGQRHHVLGLHPPPSASGTVGVNNPDVPQALQVQDDGEQKLEESILSSHAQAAQESIPRKQISVLPQIIPTGNKREIIGLTAPQPDAFVQNAQEKAIDVAAVPENNVVGAVQPQAGNPAPFVPTHIKNQLSGQVLKAEAHTGPQVPFFRPPVPGLHPGVVPGHPIRPHPGVPFPPGVSFPPAQRVRWRAHGPISRHPLHPLGRLPHGPVGLHPLQVPPGVRNIPQGVPTPPNTLERAPSSSLVSPLLPPPPPQEQLGSGEHNENFGSFQPGRESNSHFKVSFDKKEEEKTDNTEERQEEAVHEDTQSQESVNSPTVVIVHRQNALPHQPPKPDNVLNLSKTQWQKHQQQQQHRHQHTQHNPQEQRFSPVFEHKPQRPQPPLRWQLQQQQRQQEAQQQENVHHQVQVSQEQNEKEQHDSFVRQQQQAHHQQQLLNLQRQHQANLQRQHLANQQALLQQQANEDQQPERAEALPHTQPQLPQHPQQEHVPLEQRQEEEENEVEQESHQSAEQQHVEPVSQPTPVAQEEPRVDGQQDEQPQHINHHLRVQEMKHREYVQRLNQQNQHISQEEAKVYSPEVISPFHNDKEGGFVPIHGPPSVYRPSTEKTVLAKPSAFLDKLKAEQEEKKTSNLHLIEAEPMRIFSEETNGKESNIEIHQAEAVQLSEESFVEGADRFLAGELP